MIGRREGRKEQNMRLRGPQKSSIKYNTSIIQVIQVDESEKRERGLSGGRSVISDLSFSVSMPLSLFPGFLRSFLLYHLDSLLSSPSFLSLFSQTVTTQTRSSLGRIETIPHSALTNPLFLFLPFLSFDPNRQA